jgi:hypothetical protein
MASIKSGACLFDFGDKKLFMGNANRYSDASTLFDRFFMMAQTPTSEE